jgi:ribosome biogenesis GTPase / thiamine phosphate phosphatase
MSISQEAQLPKEALTTLRALGFSSHYEKQFKRLADTSLIPARVAIEHKNRYVLYSHEGELSAELAGKMRFNAYDLPAVGDWVGVRTDGESAIIHHLFERRTKFSRVAVGGAGEEQIVAANIDTVFIVVGLDQNFNVRRTERYLVLAHESGADAVIVLNKADVAEGLDEKLEAIADVSGNAPIIAVSALTGENIERLRAYTQEGQTIALMGSSGVGKSSIINALLGDPRQEVSHVSDSNAKGRHTTTHRELVKLPDGGLIMDTPGMRELQLWSTEESLDESFSDIVEIADECHFSDCSHETEPGCAIQSALSSGDLEPGRWKSYQKLQREIRHFETRNDIHAMLKQKELWKKVHKNLKDKYSEGNFPP